MSVFVDMPVSFCYSLFILADTKTVWKAGNSESENPFAEWRSGLGNRSNLTLI